MVNADQQGLNWRQDSYTKAYRFAAEAHQGQMFPGTDLPYMMHVSFVSMEVIAALIVEKDRDGDLAVQCALLHDVLEDTKVTYAQVQAAFSTQVAQGVLALTKDKTLPKADSMRDSLNRIKQQPYEVWMVKLGDRIANLAAPPHYWQKEKIAFYRKEAIEIHTALHGSSPYLGQRLWQKIEAYQAYSNT